MKYNCVSIVMPCYNEERFIEETIQSVQKQTYPDWELLIIDDGSVDNSAEIIRQAAEHDDRILYYYQKNKGSAAARNVGIRKARGQYLALLDADDIWMPNFLSEQVNFMKKKSALAVCSSYRCIDENSEEIYHSVICKRKILEKDMQIRNRVGCLTGLYNCSIFGKVYFREELGSMRDDYAYWLDVIKKTGAVYGNPEILAGYRVHAGSFTADKRKLARVQYAFYRKHLGQSTVKSIFHLGCWGICGLWKYRSNYGKIFCDCSGLRNRKISGSVHTVSSEADLS